MTEPADIASEAFLGGYNCAQAVLFSLCADIGLDRDTALRLACGFGAGMARKQDVCGAVSGGIQAIGFAHGRGLNGDKAATQVAYGKVRELISRFETENGSRLCRTLLGCDMETPEGRERMRNLGLRETVCDRCVRSAARIAADLL